MVEVQRRRRRWKSGYFRALAATDTQRRTRRSGKVNRVAVAPIRILRHAGGDHVVHLRGHIRLHGGRSRRWSSQMSDNLLLEAVAGERPLTRQRLVEDAGERVDVGTLVGLPGVQTLRRHVRPRADDHSAARETGVAGRAREPEVDQIYEVVPCDKDIRRLDIAVHQPRFVSGVQRQGHLLDDVHRTGGRQRAGSQHRLEISPLDEAHGHEEPAVDLAEIVDRDDVRFLESRRDAGLPTESFGERFVVCEVGREHFDCDDALGGGVECLPDLAHAALPQQLTQLVAAEWCPLQHIPP